MLKFVFCLKNDDSIALIPCLSLQVQPGCLNMNIPGQLLSITSHRAGGICVILCRAINGAAFYRAPSLPSFT